MTQPSSATGTTVDDVVIHIHGPGTAKELLPTVVDVYRDAFSEDDPDELTQGVDWLTQAWPRRLTTPGFRLVVATAGSATAGDHVIGAVYGHQLRPGTQWWDGADPPVSEEISTERDGRTLAIIDMMVRAGWQLHGVGARMHAVLLAAGAEERSTLLVEPANRAARSAYASWGYREVTSIQPAAFPNADPFLVLLRDAGRPGDP
jgi:GNAT superfamily N-acetyltransferase